MPPLPLDRPREARRELPRVRPVGRTHRGVSRKRRGRSLHPVLLEAIAKRRARHTETRGRLHEREPVEHVLDDRSPIPGKTRDRRLHGRLEVVALGGLGRPAGHVRPLEPVGRRGRGRPPQEPERDVARDAVGPGFERAPARVVARRVAPHPLEGVLHHVVRPRRADHADGQRVDTGREPVVGLAHRRFRPRGDRRHHDGIGPGLDLPGELAHRGDDVDDLDRVHGPADLRQVQRDEVQRDHLRRERLRGGDADLRTGRGRAPEHATGGPDRLGHLSPPFR